MSSGKGNGKESRNYQGLGAQLYTTIYEASLDEHHGEGLERRESESSTVWDAVI